MVPARALRPSGPMTQSQGGNPRGPPFSHQAVPWAGSRLAAGGNVGTLFAEGYCRRPGVVRGRGGMSRAQARVVRDKAGLALLLALVGGWVDAVGYLVLFNL